MLKSMQEVLEYGFSVLNKVYFNDKLPTIVITIMSSPRSNGYFTLGRVWRAEEGHYNEINISAEHLDRPIENIMATLCHEMVHYCCQLNGIQDTSKGGRYHNKNFKREVELRGLYIGYHKYIGYSVTTPTDEFIQVLKDNGIEKPLDINRDGEIWTSIGVGGSAGSGGATGVAGIAGKSVKKKTSTRKYICSGGCVNNFRATKDINCMCLDCMAEYIKAEGSND